MNNAKKRIDKLVKELSLQKEEEFHRINTLELSKFNRVVFFVRFKSSATLLYSLLRDYYTGYGTAIICLGGHWRLENFNQEFLGKQIEKALNPFTRFVIVHIPSSGCGVPLHKIVKNRPQIFIGI